MQFILCSKEQTEVLYSVLAEYVVYVLLEY